ncbi:MAG TPA: glycosyltransferase family 4 protein [Thermoleophilaceae bacterium]|jgi:glycosyltransferase involved in cell wall biosynthesis
MRILFVSHYATPHIGGVETVIRSLHRELRRRGHEVRHVASNASHLSREALGYDDEGVIRVRALNVLENRLGVPYPIFSPRLGHVLAREIAEADVVHSHGFLYMSSVMALLLGRARRRRRPGGPALVLTEHVGHVPYESAMLDRVESAAIRSVGKLAVRSADAVVVLNRKVGAEIEDLRPREPVIVLPNGVDTSLFRPPLPGEREALRRELGWDDTPRVLFVGRLVAKKGIEAALDATAASEGSFRLVVAGPGPLQPQGVPGVDVLGPIPSERVAELYRAADALLLPSRGEGFPVAVQEAMASGLPVVMSDDPSYAHHLDGAGLGVRFVPAVPEVIAAELRSLVSDREAWAAAGEAVRNHAREAFAWAQAAERHELLYEELLAGRGRDDDELEAVADESLQRDASTAARNSPQEAA